MGITYSEEQKRLIAAARGGDLARLQELIDSGFDVDCELKYGASALLLAAGRGEAEVVRMLIKAGAKVNRRNKFGDTPLLEAVQRGFPEVVKTLVEAGAEINIPHGNGNTAIFAATVRRDRRMVKLLLELGADPDLQNFEGWSAKKWAEAETDATIQAVFGIKKMDSESVSIKMQSEVTNNNNIEQQAKPLQSSAVEGAFWTVFMRAASAGDTNTVRQLALDGVEVNGQSPNGTTALMAAVKNGHAETAFELVELGADLSLTDIDGISAIDWAKRKGQVMIVEGLEKLTDITEQAQNGTHADKSQESGAFQKSI
jgi:ankyrin repeat protein